MASFPNIFRIILAALTVASFLPQINQIIHRQESTVISPTFVFFNLLVATDQFGFHSYLMIANKEVVDEIVDSPPTFGDWLNFTQFGLVWLCHLCIFGLLLYFARLHPGLKAFLIVTYLAVFAVEFGALPDVARAFRDRTNGSEGWLSGFVLAFHMFCLNPLATLFQTLALIPQLKELRSGTSLGALSVQSLGLQAVLFLLLAFCWPLRMFLIKGVRWPFQMNFLSWYQLIGWAPVDSLIFALMQGTLWWQAKRVENEASFGEVESLLQ